MRIETLLMGIAFFGLIVIIGVTMVAEQNANYDLGMDETMFGNLTDTFENARGTSDDIREDVSGDTASNEDQDTTFITDVIATGKRMTTAGKTAGQAIEEVGVRTGLLHPRIKDFLVFVIIVLSGAFVFYMFWRFKPN